MHSVLIAKPGAPNTGVGRYVRMLQNGLEQAGVSSTRIAPTVPPVPKAGYALLQQTGIDMRSFLLNYPVWVKYPQADVYHFTSQNLATLLLVRRPGGKSIVTVHDIIPYMLRDNPELSSYRTAVDRLFDWMAMTGLRRADYLIADSHYTKQCVVAQLGIAAEKIAVVHLGIDHARFRPVPATPVLYQRYHLPEDRRYLIYVGSEDPRKNLITLVRALAEVRRERSDVALIKVGRAHFERERQRLIDLATSLGMGDAIFFLDDVPEEDLPALYSLADICVMPSLYEGFGFPVLEAMACGTPVVCARAASLPELVGEAALLFEPGPQAANDVAATIMRLLSDPDLCSAFQTAGQNQVRSFDWSRSVEQTYAAY